MYFKGAAVVSTPSPGITNSEVAVYPSVTDIEVGLKVIVDTVVVWQGSVTVRV
jgi:hypothetical protein